ncbi:phage major capsid protein (plasmid) [Clostridioides difficile]|uniref:phage major capsid protein n=1 Tax=Clostridioides difficile TaxID=1496 RepID=UPI0021C9480E|nr:phage major capsid protein [Clostridioides difficile]UWD43273.1 phage major capsid protein [Clostridioides difficile]UWD46784.1 phage major capsid protein [Clostridioides difficile]
MTKIISRENAEAIIREQIVNDILQDAPKQSVFMNLAKKMPNMSSNVTKMRVLDILPTAYWVEGDTGYKQTTNQAWDNVYMYASELAVIVPIPESVINDADFDIIGEVTPRVLEAIGQRVDSAVIFGENRPREWQNDIITLARQAGNNVPVGSNPDYYDLIMSEGGVLNKIEEFGYMATGAIASRSMRAKLRGLKSTDGTPIFSASMQGTTNYALDGAPLHFPDNGSFNNSIAQLIVGDFNQAVYSIRQDITVKILTEGVIQDPNTREIVYNLAQQDMIALRVVFRMGWALPNPATRLDEDRVGCSFAYLEPATPVTTQTVTITVKDNANTPAVVTDAIVDVNGSRMKTNSAGKVVYNLRVGNYPMKIKKTGYSTLNDNIVVSNSAVTKDITLMINK